MIDSSSNVPKYLQIRKWLYGMIERGKITVGNKLPTEEELAKRFGVNRMTVRQAMKELQQEDMITRRPGEGTILINNKPKGFVYELRNITSFNDDMEKLGIKAGTKTLRVEVQTADPEIGTKLSLSKGEKVIFTLRIRYAEEIPVLIERSYLPYNEFKELLGMNLDGAMYHLLVEHFHIELHRSQQIFSSVFLNDEELRLFELKDPVPGIKLESVTYDANNIPVEFLHSLYRGDMYKFQVNSGKYLFQK